MAELPSGWMNTKLKEFIKLGGGSVDPSKFPDETFELYSVPSFADGQPEILRGSEIGSTKQAVQEGDVLLCKIVPHINRVWKVGPLSGMRQIASSEWIVYRDHGCDPEYLRLLLSEPLFREKFLTTVSGVGGSLMRAQPKRVAELDVPIAPLAEQARIVAKLASLLRRVIDAREDLARVPKLVDMAKAQILSAAVSGELTAGWRHSKKLPKPMQTVLGNHVTDTSYGTSAKSSPSGSTPVLRMGNIQDGKLDWTALVFTSDSTEIEKYALSAGDVLFNRTNSPALVGKSAYFDGSRVAIFAGYLIRVRCDETLNPKYLTFCLNSPQGREYSRKVKTDGVSQSNINAKKLQTYPLRLPSLREQAEIVRRLESALYKLACLGENHSSAIVELDNLEQQILAKAFRGELVPQDPSDEPASTLLARMKAEREGVKPTVPGRLPKTRKATADTHAPRKPRIAAMSKTRSDDDVWHKPYLKNLLVLEELIDGIDLSSELGIEPSGTREPEEFAQALFKKSELEIADFYKQLTWEIEAGHIVDDDGKLRAA